MAEGFTAACQVLGEFEKILLPSFGPYGKDVLMKSDTGAMYLSKEGHFILQHLQLKHPIGRLIKDTVGQYFERSGDFSKIFILILSKFLRGLSNIYLEKRTNCTDNYLVLTLSTLSKSIALVEDNMRGHFNQNTCPIQYVVEPDRFFKSYLDKLLVVKLFGSLDTPTTDKFLTFVETIVKQKQFKCEKLGYFVKHFEDFCVPVIGAPFEHSKVVDGCIIQRESHPKEIDILNAQFILVAGESVGDFEKHCVYKPSLDSIDFREESRFHEQLMQVLKQEKITCLFCENPLSNKLEKLLSRLSIVFVCHVLVEDLERLSYRYGISILSGVQDILSITKISHTIGHSEYIKSIVVGKSIACHIGPSLSSNQLNLLNIELSLCTPSQGLQIQYQRILHSIFKVLNQAYNSKTGKFVLFPAGGAFEIYVSKLLYGYHKDNEVADILSKCFLDIPKLLSQTSRRKRNDRFLFHVEVSDENNLYKCTDVASGNIMEVNTMEFYEPANSKIDLLYLLLQLSSQIIRIQNILPVVKPLKVKEIDSDDD